MQKFVSVLLVAFAMSACVSTGQRPNVYNPFLQQAVVSVVNDCAPVIDIMTPRHRIVNGVPFGEAFTVYLTRELLMGQYGTQMQLLVRARSGESNLGTASQSFYVDAYNSGNEFVWRVSHIYSSDGRNICQSR